jgi:hypothetical protein
MKRTWPIVAVRSVAESAIWYARLLNAANYHPGAEVFDFDKAWKWAQALGPLIDEVPNTDNRSVARGLLHNETGVR